MDASESMQLVPAGQVDRPERGATTRTYRFEEPRPGTYWRFREDFKGSNTNRCKCRPMKAGTVLMLSKVEMADGVPHVYHLAPHPLDVNGKGPLFHADDFLTVFEYEPNGEQIRAAEMRDLLSGMDSTRQLLAQDPPDATPVALLGHDPSSAVGEPGRELVTASQIQSMEAYAARVQADAEARSTWITTHTKTLTTQATQLAAFHQERASAQLARATDQLDGVDRLLKMVKNLKLYTGEGIEVVQLRDGVPASPNARLAIYQDVLSLDEETLILVDQGGLDHTKTDELVEALADPALVSRLIPAERGIVLCRSRASQKEFQTGSDIAASLYNSLMSEESRRKQLLVRDGERLYLVDADDVIKPIKQLMPSAGEQADYFTRRGFWDTPAEQITREDLDYAEAQRNQMNALDHYGKVLILLWGLTDKGVLFAESALPRFANWLDEGFQRSWLDLVSRDSMLGLDRPNARQWMDAHNEKMAPGSWVAIDMNKSFDETYAPGGYSTVYVRRGGGDLIWAPDDRLQILRTKSDKAGLYVEVTCHYNGHREVATEQRNIKLYVRFVERPYDGDRIPPGLLVLDRVHAADVTYYLESRQARRDYADYIELMRMARTFVTRRDAEESQLRETLRGAVGAAQISVDAPALESGITEALAVARATVRGQSLPKPGTGAYKAMVQYALDLLHTSLAGNELRIKMVEAWAENGRQPLRLARHAKRGWLLYAIPIAEELDPRFGDTGHVAVYTVDFAGGTLQVSGVSIEVLRNRKGEQVVHDWNWKERGTRGEGFFTYSGEWDCGARHYLERKPAFDIDYTEAQAMADAAVKAGASFTGIDDLKGLVERARQYMVTAHAKQVRRLRIRVVIGTVYGSMIASNVNGPSLLVAHVDALHYAFNMGDERIKRAVVAAHDIYKNPEHSLQRTKAALEWSLGILNISDANACEYELDERGVGIGIEEFRPSGKKPAERRLTTLNDAGNRLFPELVRYAERAA